MLELLALVILVAIVLGISLQNAFWGIVLFSIGLTILYILFGLGKIGFLVIGEKYRQWSAPEAKKTRAVKRKQEVKDGLTGVVVFLLIVLWIVSPVVVYILLKWLVGDSTFDYPLLVILLCAMPLVGGVLMFRKYALNLLTKKKQ